MNLDDLTVSILSPQAMLHYVKKYPNVHFLVISDDLPWCRDHLLPSPLAPVVTVPPVARSAPTDLAVLSLCNHTIGSVGTFSWWAGWLAGGEVIMYAHPIRR